MLGAHALELRPGRVLGATSLIHHARSRVVARVSDGGLFVQAVHLEDIAHASVTQRVFHRRTRGVELFLGDVRANRLHLSLAAGRQRSRRLSFALAKVAFE